MKLNIFVFGGIVLALSSCVKDKPNTAPSPSVQLSDHRKVFIVNEGNFMAGNSSISLFDPGNSEVIENFYHAQNGSNPGDVAQSMCFINSSWYIVVNNSGKIIVCDKQMKQKGVVNGLPSPRYITRASNSKAYISDLYSNSIKILDLNSNSITGSIACPGWTEQMISLYGKMFVTNMKRNYVYVIDLATDQIKDSIHVGPFTGSIVSDKYDKIWVLSSGDQATSAKPALRQLDPLTHQVLKSFEFNMNTPVGNLCINGGRDTLYFLNSGIYRMAVSSASIPNAPFVSAGNKNFYGLGINPNDYNVYVSDALDYIQRSNIYVYDTQGNQKHFFKAGINSNSFYFE